MLFALPFKPDLKCIGKDLSPAYLEGWQLLACLAQPLLSFPVGISLLYYYQFPLTSVKTSSPFKCNSNSARESKGRWYVYPHRSTRLEVIPYLSLFRAGLISPDRKPESQKTFRLWKGYGASSRNRTDSPLGLPAYLKEGAFLLYTWLTSPKTSSASLWTTN